MQLIESKTLGSAQASIQFTNIPQTFTDLYLVVSARLNYGAAVASMGLTINSAAGDSSYRWLRGNGSTPLSSSDSGRDDIYLGEAPGNNATSDTFGSFQIYIPNYTGATQKSVSVDSVTEQNGTTAYQYILAGLCSKTAAITTLTVRGFLGTSGDLVQYSSASLYGITKGSDGTTTVS